MYTAPGCVIQNELDPSTSPIVTTDLPRSSSSTGTCNSTVSVDALRNDTFWAGYLSAIQKYLFPDRWITPSPCKNTNNSCISEGLIDPYTSPLENGSSKAAQRR